MPIFISISHLDIMQCTILTNFNMQIALIVVIFHSFDTIIIAIKVIILLDNLGVNNKLDSDVFRYKVAS